MPVTSARPTAAAKPAMAAALPVALGPGVTEAALVEARAMRIMNAMADSLAVPSPAEEAAVQAEYDEGVTGGRPWTWHVTQGQPLEIVPLRKGEACVVRCPFWVRAVFKTETGKVRCVRTRRRLALRRACDCFVLLVCPRNSQSMLHSLWCVRFVGRSLCVGSCCL